MNPNDEVWAWITDTPDGRSSLVGATIPNLGHMSMVFSEKRIATSPYVRELVASHVAKTSLRTRLVHFAGGVVVEQIGKAH